MIAEGIIRRVHDGGNGRGDESTYEVVPPTDE
jgi:hypothetical protein